MKNIFASFLIVAVSIGCTVAVPQPFFVNTPSSVTECVPTTIEWAGGDTDFTLAVIANGDEFAAFSNINSDSFTWATNVPSGTVVGFTVTDDAGDQVETALVTVQPGSNACI
ncbi:uncharacterized protein PHACADRAFT_252473 [Phanerochaete carnosa HHB-10118-sp]|uniref:Dystroglycan-type cadherin-like domain-containing protein n=1 Tax=Phanerochaete carnosa (strain HHB-10118-sp) TaxID=650164 RepID=K5WG32_PHACS|nr:uncharacterized protein PHACADRAFT_252473 [Phanerochaete carnosa HHB-10118-sp]EKM58270.1 hypothetical protein PHACADRAFT_252473 [Phanerochaete carnosa HHB-10118-sp]